MADYEAVYSVAIMMFDCEEKPTEQEWYEFLAERLRLGELDPLDFELEDSYKLK